MKPPGLSHLSGKGWDQKKEVFQQALNEPEAQVRSALFAKTVPSTWQDAWNAVGSVLPK